MAGAVPGAIMAIAMCAMVYIISKKRGYRKEEWCGFRALFHSFRRAFLSLLTVVVILGGILAGIFTPTEAAIIATFYAIFLGFFYRTLTLKKLLAALKEASETTCTVMMIVCGATIFCYILSFERFPQMVANLFLTYVDNKYMALFVIQCLPCICRNVHGFFSIHYYPDTSIPSGCNCVWSRSGPFWNYHDLKSHDRSFNTASGYGALCTVKSIECTI